MPRPLQVLGAEPLKDLPLPYVSEDRLYSNGTEE